MHLRSHIFRVTAEVRAGEVVGVTGDVPQLGDWKIGPNHTLVLLTKDSNSSIENLWTGKTWLPASQDVHYRYYVGVQVEDHVMISQREVSLLPRCILKDVPSNTEACDKSWDVFGGLGGNVDRGWLTHETVLQFKLHSNPIHFWKTKYSKRQMMVKVTPVSLSRPADSADVGDLLENSLSLDTQETISTCDVWPISEVADLNAPEPTLSAQEQFGRALNDSDFLLFQVQVDKPDEMAYLMDFYSPHPRGSENDLPDHIGFSHILPSLMRGSEGHLVVPIISTHHRPIGQLSIYFLKIFPIPNYVCDMSVSYSKYWKHSSTGLEVGHRGMGNSFKQKSCAEVRENTIASLKEAASHGADFVEFDVQLSKDLVPVIYHDFHVCIALKKKNSILPDEMLEFPLKELTLNQLHCFKLYHRQEGKENQQLLFDDELEEHQPFPKLQHAFEVIDPVVGFNIEIKWTMALKDGTFELDNPFDLNTYLDAVLKVVMEYGGSREIVFSCFHPDICTMVKYKQPKYPVVFLTQGETAKYPMYQDPRCHTIPHAVRFARCMGMLGINVHTEDILRDPSHVEFVKNNSLVLFCWGDDNNNPKTITYLKKLGLNAIIYDKIDELGPKKRKSDTVILSGGQEERQELLEMLRSDVGAVAPSTSAARLVPQPS